MRKSTSAGQTPSLAGYPSTGENGLPGLNQRHSCSAQPKIIFQGLINDQTSPMKADAYATPTHQITQTNVGARLYIGFWLPAKPTDTNKAKRARKFGTQVIDQAEMMGFVKCGKFPSVRL